MKNKKWRYTFVLIGMLLFLCSACALGRGEAESSMSHVDQGEDAKDPIEVPPSKDDTDAAKDPSPSSEQETPVKDDPTVGRIEPEKTQPESTKPFWQSETTRLTNNLISIASAGQTDYKVNGAKRGWMSKSGELYSYYDGKYITTDTLVADGYLEKGLSPSDYKILLVNGSDLVGIDGASVPSDSMDFGVFAATKQSGKYLIASSSGKVGTISEEDFNSLLAKYNQSNGKIVRLSSASAEYERILNYISLFEGRFDDYYVREIRMDNKHAVVVFSNRIDTSNIKQYILENENNFWEVVFPNAQTEYYPVTSVNRYLPNFNVELLPTYTLASWRGSIVREQGGAVAALFSAKAISSASEIVYQCATSTCAYTVLSNGSRYVCYSENGIWKAAYVTSDNGARNLLREKTGIDYGFLILDD
ncbi:hypothetical protein [Anaerotignum sp. MB30-C6]|uniref:hypothetical protein n=1 Tax=Anaerotignum sp. MB30-C6 TaxID=3070814 RepID=UPI0027DB4BDA|nr:hypothetical protein [Anaerotignum sp. MB30-C6]WMI80460.1 hypothetical protein RBQ60_11565 [Anaerotignum sp. MB30-C6]